MIARPPIIDARADRLAVGCVVLDLPMPSGVSNLFANSTRGERQFANSACGGRHRTAAYLAWVAEAGWALCLQRPGRIAGRFAHFVIEDDSFAEEITLRWVDDLATGGVRVTISEWSSES